MISDDLVYRCPRCGHTDNLDGFDVGGANPGNLFCIKCHFEDPMQLVEEDQPIIVEEPLS